MILSKKMCVEKQVQCIRCLNSNLGWGYDAIISSKTPFEDLHVASISERGPDSDTI